MTLWSFYLIIGNAVKSSENKGIEKLSAYHSSLLIQSQGVQQSQFNNIGLYHAYWRPTALHYTFKLETQYIDTMESYYTPIDFQQHGIEGIHVLTDMTPVSTELRAYSSNWIRNRIEEVRNSEIENAGPFIIMNHMT